MKTTIRMLVVGILVWLSAKAPLTAQPANDFFVNRQILVGTNSSVAGDNSFASSEPGEDTGSNSVGNYYSVWYEWTAPTAGVMHCSVTTEVVSFYPGVGVYQGENLETLSGLGSLPDGGVAVSAGTTIVLRVVSVRYHLWGGGGNTGPFALELWLETPLPTSSNDDFADRFSLSTPFYEFEGSIYGATVEAGEPLVSLTATQTLWFGFVAPNAGSLMVDASAPQFTPQFALYEGEQLESLTLVSPLQMGGNVFSVAGGRSYALQIASEPIPVGALSVVTRYGSIENDAFASSLHLEGTNLFLWCDNQLATQEPGEVLPLPTSLGQTLWYSWVAPFNGRVTLRTSSNDRMRVATVYTGPSMDRLDPITSAADVLVFLALADTVYHFQGDGVNGIAGPFTLSLQAVAFGPTTNDDFDEAIELEGMRPTSVGYIADATLEPGEPAHLEGAPSKSLWWHWRAPVSGVATIGNGGSLATNLTFAVYDGSSVEGLTLLAKDLNGIRLTSIPAGTEFQVAVVADAPTLGDVLVSCNSSSGALYTPSYTVPGNLLCESSFEGTALGLNCWHVTPGISGYVGEPGGADGTTWIVLSPGGTMWQEFPTVAGRMYEIRFSFRPDFNAQSTQVRTWWNQQDLGSFAAPPNQGTGWRSAAFTATATTETTRLTMENQGLSLGLDALSVVPLDSPPSIVTDPSSISTFLGSGASFLVGASGSPPLSYQWYFNDELMPGQTAFTLSFTNVGPGNAGTYSVVVSNAFGTASSSTATLLVEEPSSIAIVLQPYGDTVFAGGYFVLNVAAVGTPPLRYQWFFHGMELPGATNTQHTLAFVLAEDAGIYTVRVSRGVESVWSLPAQVVVATNVVGGGAILFDNGHLPEGGQLISLPITDVDQVTRLSGSAFLAQLYAGTSLEQLRPTGEPSRFLTGFDAGLFEPQIIILPGLPPLTPAFGQVRVWESSEGVSYEIARALGGRFGKSEVLAMTPGIYPNAPPLWYLKSFSLQAGLPQFRVGVIRLVERQPEGIVVWEHQGQPGFRYVIEKRIEGSTWQPLLIITNTTSAVTFTDSALGGANAAFYRSRILD